MHVTVNNNFFRRICSYPKRAGAGTITRLAAFLLIVSFSDDKNLETGRGVSFPVKI
jgi:hypothetical protein